MCSIVLPRRSCTQTVDDMSDCKGLQQSMPPTRSSTRSREESSPMVSKRHESFSVEVSECAPTTKRSKVSSSWPQASSANTGTNTNIHTNMIRILILILILMLYIYIYICICSINNDDSNDNNNRDHRRTTESMEQKTGSTTGWRHDMLGSFPKQLRPDAILSAGSRENSVEVRVQGLVAPSGAHIRAKRHRAPSRL